EPVDAVTEIQELVTRDSNVEDGQSYSVGGEAIMRSENHKVVDTMLLIGLALLAVSVLVALVGVSNTLSLSVIERARETALLRALGLTRGGVRMMLALEGMVIAGVAGLMGVLIGWGYGSLGAALLLGPTDYAAMAVPVERLLLILVLSVLVGLLAAILPGRRAAKTAPAEALASE
ncbi:MAG: ABC transporter permease, partial [Bifidobacteriaceae bacterium]|nr:ABC transporter permease [Bifidobacteriaceae bacterium]